MSLVTKIKEDIKNAMKTKNPVALGILRIADNSLTLTAKEKKAELSDVEAVAIIRKEIKKLDETLVFLDKKGGIMIPSKERQEKWILEGYLPKAMTDAELGEVVTAAIVELQALTKKDMGKVIKLVKERTEGRVEGATISKFVSNVLK